MINIISPSRYRIDKKLIKNRVHSYLGNYNDQENNTVNIIFIGKRKMKQIVLKYKNEDVALPVLSFPYKKDKDTDLLGEIFICYPQAILLAAERHKKADEMINQLIVHGIDNLLK